MLRFWGCVSLGILGAAWAQDAAVPSASPEITPAQELSVLPPNADYFLGAWTCEASSGRLTLDVSKDLRDTWLLMQWRQGNKVLERCHMLTQGSENLLTKVCVDTSKKWSQLTGKAGGENPWYLEGQRSIGKTSQKRSEKYTFKGPDEFALDAEGDADVPDLTCKRNPA